MSTSVRVLLGASYGPAFQSVLYGLRRQQSALDIVTLDMNPRHIQFARSQGCDARLVPPASSPDYAEALTEIVRDTRPLLYLPILDAELEAAARQRELLLELGCRTFVSPAESVTCVLDKRSMYAYCMMSGIPYAAPVSLACVTANDYPLFIKPARGVGSRNAVKIESPRDLAYWTEKLGDYALQPFIHGTEYTIDVVRVDGHVYGALPRERVDLKAGVSLAGCTARDPAMTALAAKIADHFDVEGICNIQIFRDEASEELLFSEINLRPAGASVLSIKAGFNLPAYLLRIALGEKPKDLGDNYAEGARLLYYWEPSFS